MMLVPDVTIRFRLDERDLTLRYGEVPFAAWAELKRRPGFTPKTLLDALGEWDIDALVAVIWLERKQRERRLGFGEVATGLSQGEQPEFELTDIGVDGKSLMGSEPDDGEPDAGEVDPTTSGTS